MSLNRILHHSETSSYMHDAPLQVKTIVRLAEAQQVLLKM